MPTELEDRRAEGPKPGLRVAILAWGFVASVVLVIAGAFVSILDVSRAQHEVATSFRDGERTTYLIGHVGKELARATVLLREAISEGPTGLERASAEVPRIIERIASAEQEIALRRSPVEPGLWSPLSPDLERFRGDLATALQALEQGDVERADQILDDAAARAGPIYQRLSDIARHNRREIDGVLRAAEQRFERLKLAEYAAGAALLFGVAAAWTFAIRTIRRQRREIDSYLVRVEAANDDLDAFAGRIAHDLRNALSPLAMAADILAQGSAKPETVQAVARRVRRACSRTTVLVDAMLMFSRAGKASDDRGSSSLEEEVQSCLDELRPQAERVGATIEVHLEDDLHPAITPGLLHSVIANLLSNAVKFLEGRERREVRITARSDADMCLVVIEDTGPGIPGESLARVFEPFYRVPGSAIPGTGIGLATVQRIVQAHDGRIDVESVVGEGTRFEVRLPPAAAQSRAALVATPH